MDLNHKNRWVFGPVVDGMHAGNDYAIACSCPLVFDGFALAHCTMNAHQMAAARKDPRLTILDSIHSRSSIPDHVADHHEAHGATRGMATHELLLALSRHHHCFELED